VDIDDYMVVAAPFGGPVALARDPNKVTAFRLAGPGASDSITIYSAAGRLLGRADTDSSRLVGVGWASNESLVAVHENGAVGM
jgi:vacuolar protein sorting-associated protein 16